MTVPFPNRFKRVNELQGKLGAQWSSINKAIERTENELQELRAILAPDNKRPLAEDASAVFFGSLARGECTSSSDVDWVLLVDGQVDEQHFLTFHRIREQLKSANKSEPGTTGTFGDLVFGYDLVHRIGGSDDTNRNLTLRMLLLLESVSIGNDDARDRVIKAILGRYLADDPSWTWRTDGKLPRFLLNDAVRFWRTMTVDFADKFHDQIGEKWALRNTKLRFSRKLIFLVAILACFSWQLHPPVELSDPKRAMDIPIKHFKDYLSRPPLEIVADELLLSGTSATLCDKLFSSYNDFLAVLDDPEMRKSLKELPRDIASESVAFQRARELSHAFQSGLTEWLFMPDTELSNLVKQYGIF